MIGVGLSAGLSGSRRARTVQDPLPALDLDWATNRSLPASYGPTPTFTRASTGTYFDGQGILQTAAVNGPRFNHVFNGTSWVSKGLLLEEQRTNFAIRSNTFSNAAWEKYDSSISSSGTGPDGSTASLLTENTANGAHWLRQQTSTSVASGAGVSVTASIFVKANGRSVVGFGFDNSFAFVGKSVRGRFDLSDKSFANEYNCDSYSITNVGNGWYRLSVTSTTIQAGVARFDFFLYNSDTSGGITYTGDGSSGVLLFGAQVEAGAFPTSYIGTTSSSVVRSADVCQITGSGFSGFWNGTEGSVAVEFDQLADASKMTNESYIYGFQNATDYEQFILRGQSGGIYYWRSVNNGNVEASAQISSLGTATVKHAACYKLNDFASTFNGAAVVSDTSGATPAPTLIGIGFNSISGSNRINGHIARLRYFPTRLSNAKLQELST